LQPWAGRPLHEKSPRHRDAGLFAFLYRFS
jgi:hypothetical protein